MIEKRKFTRFKVRDEAYAALRGDISKVGKIYDISLNGLAFRYFSKETFNEKFSHVDIFSSNNEFHLSDVPCAVVCEEKECLYYSPLISSYRCGLMFGWLTDEQVNELKYFLDNYTTGVLNP
jgi:hypothetical protein